MPSDSAGRPPHSSQFLRRALRGVAVSTGLFAFLGTVTAVWANPFFGRMTPVGPWEFGATLLTALFAGLTASFWVPQCKMRSSGAGGVASFLGIACPTCNKILMLVFGGPALLAWFDPIRPGVAAAGVAIMGLSAARIWRAFIRLSRENEVKGRGRNHAPV